MMAGFSTSGLPNLPGEYEVQMIALWEMLINISCVKYDRFFFLICCEATTALGFPWELHYIGKGLNMSELFM